MKGLITILFVGGMIAAGVVVAVHSVRNPKVRDPEPEPEVEPSPPETEE